MSNSMLPSSATPQERALAEAIARLSDVPVLVREFWDPDACPAVLLPWLAQAHSVDAWDTTWTEQQKRDAIKASVYVHQHKGTAAAMKVALDALGYDARAVEWHRKVPQGDPYTFSVAVNLSQVGLPTEASWDRFAAVANAAKNVRSHMTGIEVTAKTSGTFYAGCAAWSGETVVLASELSPDLLLDFTTEGRSYPGLTCARAGAATRINASGSIEGAPENTLRISKNPVNGKLGLLVEEARTNLLLNSALNGSNLSTQSVAVTAQPYTLSFYGSGTVTLSGAASASVVGSGAFPARKTHTFTPTAGTLTLTVTGTVQFANLEVGSFATSFIPTGGTSVTRNADVVQQALGSWFNASEGTLAVEGSVSAPVSFTRRLAQFSGAGNTNRIMLGISSTTSARFFADLASVMQGDSSAAITSSANANKVAGAYKQNDFRVAANGTLGNADTVGDVPTVSVLYIGSDFGTANSGIANGHIHRVEYFRRRLTNDQLQRLTGQGF